MDLSDSKYASIYSLLTLFMFPILNSVCGYYIITFIAKTYEIEEVEQRNNQYTEKSKLNRTIDTTNVKRPFINILVSEDDINHYSNGSYINFLLHLYTKVLLNAGWYATPLLTNDFLLPDSQYLDAYIHYSCWTLGHLIIKNLLIKYASLSREDEVHYNLFDLDLLRKLNDRLKDNESIHSSRESINNDMINCLTNQHISQMTQKLHEYILNYKYVEFLVSIYENKDLLHLEISDYNTNYYKYNNINNTQLQKQVKKYILANTKFKEEKRYKLYKKKLLYISVEHISEMVKIDCIEDPYIHYLEFYIENYCNNRELAEKYSKIKYSSQLLASLGSIGSNNSADNSIASLIEKENQKTNI